MLFDILKLELCISLSDLDANMNQGGPLTPFKDYPMAGPPVDIAEPLVRLFLREENTTRVTKGEEKAKRIEDSFKNPFQKFLPAKKFSEISIENSKKEDKTKSSEVVTEEGEGGSRASDDDVVEVAHRYTKAAERYTKTERYTKMPESVANSTPQENKKRKQKNADASEDEIESATALRVKKHKKKNKKQKRVTNNEETALQSTTTGEFLAYDYNNASLNFDKAENGEDGKADVFNPYKKLKEKGKSKFKSKVHMKSGERSMTFNQK